MSTVDGVAMACRWWMVTVSISLSIWQSAFIFHFHSANTQASNSQLFAVVQTGPYPNLLFTAPLLFHQSFNILSFAKA